MNNNEILFFDTQFGQNDPLGQKINQTYLKHY